jgi:hypothetical protein
LSNTSNPFLKSACFASDPKKYQRKDHYSVFPLLFSSETSEKSSKKITDLQRKQFFRLLIEKSIESRHQLSDNTPNTLFFGSRAIGGIIPVY